MLKITVKFDGMEGLINAAKKFPTQGMNEIDRAIKSSIYAIQSQAFKTTPVNKQVGLGPTLRQSIKTRMGRLWGEVYTTVKYAIYVHEGTSPSPGRFVPGLGSDRRGRRLVHGSNIGMHPGQRANPYMKNAVIGAEDRIQSFFNTALTNILRLLK